MQKIIRIGTRDSELALWQAKKVQSLLEELEYTTQIVPIKSTGDIVLDKPLYELGVTGIFTKNLDIAMLNGDIDIAVHSMKDVPTVLPEGIVQAAVLKRANYNDILVLKDNEEFMAQPEGVIATSSLRRKAQWLNRYPTHKVEDLRGNVNTRLQKVIDNEWNGAIFAAAGLERINLKPDTFIELDWMVPAPAQGAMLVVAMENDTFCKEAVAKLNHKESEICTFIERQFLRTLEGGCTAPIGALAKFKDEEIHFQGVLFSLDGKQKFNIEKNCTFDNYKTFGERCANEILTSGGNELMVELRKTLKVK